MSGPENQAHFGPCQHVKDVVNAVLVAAKAATWEAAAQQADKQRRNTALLASNPPQSEAAYQLMVDFLDRAAQARGGEEGMTGGAFEPIICRRCWNGKTIYVEPCKHVKEALAAADVRANEAFERSERARERVTDYWRREANTLRAQLARLDDREGLVKAMSLLVTDEMKARAVQAYVWGLSSA